MGVRKKLLDSIYRVERTEHGTKYRKKEITAQSLWKRHLEPILKEYRDEIIDEVIAIATKNMDDPENVVRDNLRRNDMLRPNHKVIDEGFIIELERLRPNIIK